MKAIKDTNKCGKCGFGDISVIKLDRGGKEIPASIKGVIEPSYEQLGNIQFASKFQHNQLKELVKHLEEENLSLKNKNNRFKELLRKSRIELDKCNEYQKEIERLKEENGRLLLKIQIGDSTNSRSAKHHIEDNELEIDEISIEEFNFAKSSSGASKGSSLGKKDDFVRKMRKFSQTSAQIHRNKENIEPFQHFSNKSSRSKNEKGVARIGSSSFNIEAESTSLRKGDRSLSLQVPTAPLKLNKINLVTSTAGNTSKYNYNHSGNDHGDKMSVSRNGISVKRKFMFKPPSRNLSGGKFGGLSNGILSSDIATNNSTGGGSILLLNRGKGVMK